MDTMKKDAIICITFIFFEIWYELTQHVSE